MTTLSAHAIELAAAGWRIFPCRAKVPLTDHGHLDATDDLKQVEKWWSRWPDAMIGAAVPDGAIVIDFDPRTNPNCFAELERLLDLPVTLTVHSGRGDGGRHLYYQRPHGALTSTRLPAGIDLKASGYAIVPPSPHPATGEPYTWELHPVAPLPIALRELLRPALRPILVSEHSRLAKTDGLVRTVLEAAEGNRNGALYWAACRAVDSDVIDILEEDLFYAAVSVGLSEREVRRTIDSARGGVGGMSVPPAPRAPDPINGAELLDEIRTWLSRFIITTTEGDLDLLTLWCAHTHLAREVRTTPRLQIDSPIPECGKTTVLEHLLRLCVRPVLMAVATSPAMLTRMLEVEIRTLLIDEADRSLNKDKPGVDDLYAVLNSGYKQSGTRPVLVPGKNGQWVVAEMPTFAPVALAGNQPALPDDTRSRIIRVLLLPDFEGAAEESNWELIEDDALALRGRLEDWADQVRDGVKKSQPVMPEGIIARFREKWQPLRRVADAAGGRWSEMVNELALLDKAEHDASKEAGLITEKPGTVLLKHLHELWPDDTAFWPTLELIDTLVLCYPGMWSDASSYGKRLTPQRMGWMLVTNCKVHSKREGHGTPRGYYRAHFTKAWQSMGLPPGETGSTGWSRDTGSSSEPESPEQPLEPLPNGGYLGRFRPVRRYELRAHRGGRLRQHGARRLLRRAVDLSRAVPRLRHLRRLRRAIQPVGTGHALQATTPTN